MSNPKWPEHKAGMYITHNQHKTYYLSIEEYVHDLERDCGLDTWNKPEDRELVLKTDEIWELQWHPSIPIGFYAVVAPTFERLLEVVNE